jgi:farnesyl diphosphate synthase
VQIERALNEAASSANRMLDELIPSVTGSEARVVEAMRYATMGGGKRIRPYLVLNCAVAVRPRISSSTRRPRSWPATGC